VKLRDGSRQSLKVGDQTPNRAAYYAQRAEEQAVLLMESATIDQLHRLATTPPERPTPVPTLAPLTTPTPTG
jgi:hypothetical protein